MTQNQKMRDFVKSLENNQFSKEQEAMLLVGKADTLQAGSNGKCENSLRVSPFSNTSGSYSSTSSPRFLAALFSAVCLFSSLMASHLNDMRISWGQGENPVFRITKKYVSLNR